MRVLTCNSSTGDLKKGGLRVQGQPGLQKSLFQEKPNKSNNTPKPEMP